MNNVVRELCACWKAASPLSPVLVSYDNTMTGSSSNRESYASESDHVKRSLNLA